MLIFALLAVAWAGDEQQRKLGELEALLHAIEARKAADCELCPGPETCTCDQEHEAVMLPAPEPPAPLSDPPVQEEAPPVVEAPEPPPAPPVLDEDGELPADD